MLSACSARRSQSPGSAGALQRFVRSHQVSQEPIAARLQFQVEAAASSHLKRSRMLGPIGRPHVSHSPVGVAGGKSASMAWTVAIAAADGDMAAIWRAVVQPVAPPEKLVLLILSRPK